jgi:hypothetical protein
MHRPYFCTFLLFTTGITFKISVLRGIGIKMRQYMRWFSVPPNGKFIEAVSEREYRRKSFSEFCFVILVVHTVD